MIKFTPEAGDTFDALVEQLLKRWGYEYVYRFEDRVSKALAILAKTLLLYPTILETSNQKMCSPQKLFAFI